MRAREAARVGMRRVRCLRRCVERGGSRDDVIVTVGAGGRRKIVTLTCVPYSRMSETRPRMLLTNGTQDLVLSSSTHTNAIQAIAVASKRAHFFLLHPLV